MSSCFKCGSSSKDDRSIILFSVPPKIRNPAWHFAFLKHLGLEDLHLNIEDIRVCDRHFRTEDLKMNENNLVLKENALPLEEVCEQFEIKPEVIYMNNTEEIEEDGETHELAPLAPVVKYEYVGNQEMQASSLQGNPLITGHQLISIMQEDGTVVEPVMPFFLSSSPMFTVVNGSNEHGETIILQIENQEEDVEVKDEVIESLEESKTAAGAIDENKQIPEEVVTVVRSWDLCEPKKNDVEDVFVCEICEKSYCCVNCLKSHYEAMHVTNTTFTRYKCKWTSMQKGLYCPVCEMCFENRNDTLDHYLTHSVACEVCGSGFDRQQLLVEHMFTIHKKVNCYESYECVFCKATYQYHWNLTKHYQVYHKMIMCYICKSRYPSATDLQEHLRTHLRKINVLPYACSKCNKAFPQISDIAVHIRRDHSASKSPVESENYVGHTVGGKSKSTDDSVVTKKKRIKVK
nr:unnamed protein product [Callosobruchus chinensis]